LSGEMGDTVMCICLGPLNNYKDELQDEGDTMTDTLPIAT